MNYRLTGLVSILLLLVCGQTASADEGFDYDKFKADSLLFQLRDKKGSFSSDIEVVYPDDKLVNHIEEKFSFDLKVGEYVGQEFQNNGKDETKTRFTAKLIYLDDISEIYQISKDPKLCETKTKDRALDDYFYDSWAPADVFDSKASYPILGPNVLWWIFIDRYEKDPKSIICENGKSDEDEKATKVQCSTVFNEEVTLKFDFGRIVRGDDDWVMVPEKIRTYQKNQEKSDVLFSQFNYFKFTPWFNVKKPIVSTNLPIGYGCVRSRNTKEKYHEMKTNYGDRFELEYEVVFTYPETDANRKPQKPEDHNTPSNPNDREPGGHGDGDDTPVPDPKKEAKQITEIFFNKMYHDEAALVNVVDTVDEFQHGRVPTRTIYDMTTYVNYDIFYLDEKKCHAYHLRPNHKIDFHYVQDLFINTREFFHTDGEYEYIGEYPVRNIPTLVFEKKISNFNKEPEKVDGDTENEQYLRFFRNNTNQVKSDHATVTHFYPAINNYWSKNSDLYNVPMKIEIRLFDNETRLNEVARLTINVASFKHDASNYDIFDVDACIENDYDYNWFLVKFDDASDGAKYKKYSSQIENAFRQLMGISPLRIGEVLVDGDENSIYVTAKLLESAQTLGYFRTQSGLSIKKEQVVEEFADSEELCARHCFTSKNCGAFSYCAGSKCTLWFDDDFHEEFDPSLPLGQEYDWEKIKKEKDNECTFGSRVVRYNERNHQSNKEFLAQLDAKIKSAELEKLVVVDENFDDKDFTAIELLINVQPGRHTANPNRDDLNLADERNYQRYNDLFMITDSKSAFDPKKVQSKKGEGEKERLIASSLGLALWECQLLCINNEDCKSMSYCGESNECILTTIETIQEIDDNTQENHKCAVSAKKFLAQYHKVPRNGLPKTYVEKEIGLVNPLSENLCASDCKNTKGCESFDFCIGKPLNKELDGPEETKYFGCYLHDKDPANDKKTEEEEWEVGTHCHHYTEKHAHEFVEYAAVKLNLEEKDFISTHSKVSLDQCANQCTEQLCNTFDYCFEKNEKGHPINTHCRLMGGLYAASKTTEKQFDCSVYSRIVPKTLTQKVEKLYDNPVSAGLTTFLSILFLALGAAIGFGAAYYVIKYYFVSY